MASVNSEVVADEEITPPDPVRETHPSQSDQSLRPDSYQASRVRRLDVDAVLARSLAKVVSE